MKRAIILLIMILCLALFSGCWNYHDVEEQFVVMGMAVDFDESTQEYLMYAEVSRAKGGAEAENITRLEQATGSTLFEANRNLITKIGAKVYWGHTSVYIISQRAAERGIADVIGILSKLTQVRTDIYIIIAEDESIERIFEFEDPIHENVAQHLQDLMNNYESSGDFRAVPLFRVIQELASDEVSLVLPYIKMIEIETSQEGEGEDEQKDEDSPQKEEKPTEIIIVEGCAVFSGDRMIGRMTPEESLAALIIKEEVVKGYAITLDEDKDHPNATLEVINSQMKINTKTEGDDVFIMIDLSMETDLVEVQSTQEEYLYKDNKEDLENGFEDMLKEQLNSIVKKNQIQTGVDIFSFAGYIHRQHQKYWKYNNVYWDDIYKDAVISVNVDVNIKSSALTFKPLEVNR